MHLRRLLSLVFILCFVTLKAQKSSTTINPEDKDSGYSYSLSIAKQFLIQRGIEEPDLKIRYSTETYCVISDIKKKCFVIVTSDRYMSLLDNPILAFSVGEWAWNSSSAPNNSWVKGILDQYDSKLKYLLENNEYYTFRIKKEYLPKSLLVEPLLGDIKYNQGYPYNKLFPFAETNDGTRKAQSLVGCGPVAMAQILSYYHHPIKLKGRRAVSANSKKTYRDDLSNYPVVWDGSEDDIANLMYGCALSVSVDMSPNATSSNIVNLRESLIKYWGYSGSCKRCKEEFDDGKLGSIYKELENKRPIIMEGFNHFWVCDGFEQDYLHFNPGWGGSYNGFYRVMLVQSMGGKDQLPLTGMLIGIEPLDY